MPRFRKLIACVFVMWLIGFSSVLTGCTSAEESEVLSALQAALASLNQNRTLIEQYGRDIQSRVDPSSETYADLMEGYVETRDAYNHYLESLARATMSKHPQSELKISADKARDATARFMAGATRTLDRNAPLRGVVFREAIELPDSVTRDLRRIPKREREEMVNHFTDQMKVRSWGKLTSTESGQ